MSERAEIFRSIFETAEVGIGLSDGEGRILDVNPYFCRMTGYDPEELRACTVADLTHPDDRELQQEYFARLRRGEIDRFSCEKRYIRKDGSICWVHLSVSLFARPGGELVYIATVQDITPWKTAEADLQRSRAAYRDTVDSIDGVVWEADADSLQMQFVSSRAARLLGLPIDDWYGPGFWEQHVYEDDRRAALAQRRSASEASDATIEYRMVAVDQRLVWVRDHFIRAGAGGKILRGVLFDITREKALEDQLRSTQRLESVGRLAGGIAHDFNNLLTAISGYAHLAGAQTPPGSPVASFLEEILRAATRATQLTRQLLAFARQQVGARRPIQIARTIRDAEALLRPMLGSPWKLKVDVPDDLWWVSADPGQIQHVLLALAARAVEACAGGGSLTVRAANWQAGAPHDDQSLNAEDHVCIEVFDSAPPIPEARRAGLFEPFASGAAAGLGLAAVHGAVAQNGGTIFLAPATPGQCGNTFRILLPRCEAAPDRAVLAAPARTTFGGETILLVDDEPLVRSLAVRALRDQGYSVLEAGSGEEGERIAGTFPDRIDLLLTDVVMPGITGTTLAKRLSEKRPGMRTLFTSGFTTEVAAMRDASQQGDAFLQKPYTPTQLTRTVRALLDTSTPPGSDSHSIDPLGSGI